MKVFYKTRASQRNTNENSCFPGYMKLPEILTLIACLPGDRKHKLFSIYTKVTGTMNT